MKNFLFGSSAAIALLAAAPALADAGLKISYVPKSLAQSVIKHGPWTLHESADRFEGNKSGDHFRHDDSDEGPKHDDIRPFQA